MTEPSRQSPAPGKWADRVPIRMQTMLIAVVALVAAGAVTVFGSAYTVWGLKNQLVMESRESTRERARETSRSLADVITRVPGSTIQEIAGTPALKSHISMMVHSGAPAFVCILNREGETVFASYCSRTLSGCVPPGLLAGTFGSEAAGTIESFEKALPDQIITVQEDLVRDGEVLGSVHVAMSTLADEATINNLSNDITAALMQMVLIVFAILLLSIVLLAYAFRRQWELMRRTAESEHLASIGALAGGLAHEIRNPLQAIDLNLDVVHEDITHGEADQQTVCSTLQKVRSQVSRLNGIVSQFVSVAVNGHLERKPVVLNDVLGRLATSLQSDFEKRGIDFRLHLGAPFRLEGDANALHQVFLNLLLNSADCLRQAPDPQLVVATAEEKGGMWRIDIDDSRPGFVLETEADQFCSFVPRRDGGTGLGLATLRRLVRDHGGTLAISRSPLGGARYTIRLPARPVDLNVPNTAVHAG